MATAKQNKEFKETLLPTWPLDQAIEWINQNMSPQDVFTDDKLERWAINEGYEHSSNDPDQRPGDNEP